MGTNGCQRLVGRPAELAALDDALAEALDGHGSAVLIVGEAGIGKSRLLAEASARASAAGMEVLSGRAVPAGGTYRALTTALLGRLRGTSLADHAEIGPYRAALGRIVPDFGPAADTESAVDPALVLGEGVLRLLRVIGAGRGCLVLLDDLHWADPDTMAVVEYLVDQVTNQPILICGAARAEPRTSSQIEQLGRRIATPWNFLEAS